MEYDGCGSYVTAVDCAAGPGNLTKAGGGALEIAYDGGGRVWQTRSGGAVTGHYGYDGEGRRVQRVVGAGVSTTYVYDAMGQLALEYGPSAAVTATLYVGADHLGSKRVETDKNGVAVWCGDYLPFGESIPAAWGRSGCYGAAEGASQATAVLSRATCGLPSRRSASADCSASFAK